MTARARFVLPPARAEFRAEADPGPGPESIEVFRGRAVPVPGVVEFRAAGGGELRPVSNVEAEPAAGGGADRGQVRRHRAKRGRSRHRRGNDRGSAALEVALMTPVVLLFLVACVGAVTALGTKISCVDAAGTAVRAVARGEAVPDFGGGTDVAVERDGDVVRVVVRMRMPAGFTVEERAVAMVEPDPGAGT